MISVGRFYIRPIRAPKVPGPVPVPLPEPIPGPKPVPAPAPAPVKPSEEDEQKKQKEAPLVGVNAHVELIDYCAQVIQTQRFRNNEETALEATYEFELPKGCAVSSFSADVGDRHLVGKIQDKQKAEDSYDDALAAGHSAALLEAKEEDPNTFFVQLGNVAPGTEAFVTLTYERLATLVDDKIVLTLDGSDAKSVIFAEPPAKTPENDARVEPGFHFTVHVATQTPLKSVSSPSHPIVVELGSAGATVRLAEGADWRENKNFVLEAAVADPHQPSVRIQKNDKAQMAMVSFYPKIETQQTKCEMIFVLDRSGSMSGSAIECAKSTLQFFLRSLPEDAYFNILSFGSRYERFKPESVPFNDDTLAEATEHVKNFRANMGGTNIYDPLDSIFKQPTKPGYPRQVFILTDGEVNNKDRCIDLVRKNVNTTRLFSFGIGSSVDKDLVNGMARAGEGSSSIVRDTSSIRQSVMKQLEHAVQPGLTDIHITWKDAATGTPLPDGVIRQTPLNPPPIFRGSRLVSFALLPEDCKACKVVLTGSFGDSEYTSEVDMNPASSENVPGEQIIKLGVRSLIEDIQNGCGGIPSDKQDEIKKAVTELSTRHDVLSKFTAFVAIGSGGESLEASMVTRRVSRRHEVFRGGFGGGFGGQRNMLMGCAPAMKCCMRPMGMPMMAMACPPPAPMACPPVGMAMDSKKRSKRRAAPVDDGAVYACPPMMECCAEAPRAAPKAAKNGRASSPVKAETKSAPPPSLDKSLDNVIMQQKASGCFGALALELLDIPESAKNAKPTVFPDGVDAKLAEDIWTTLLVLIGLEKKFGDKKDEWNFLAMKSEKWARSKLGDAFDTWKAAAEISF